MIVLTVAGVYGLWSCVAQWPHTTKDPEWHLIQKGGILTFTFCMALALVGNIFDETWHFPLAGIIANGQWPTAFFWNPDFELLYHYSFDLLVAFGGAIGAPIPWVSDLLMALLQASVIGLVYHALRGYGCTARRALTGAIAWACAASAGWIIRLFRPWLPETLAIIAPFHGSTINALLLVTYTKSLLIAMGLLLLMLLMHRRIPGAHHGWRGAGVVVIALAAAALSSETLFVVFAPLICIAYIVERQPLARHWRIGVIGCAALIVILQGGMLSSFIQVLGGKGAAESQTHTALSVFWSPIQETFSFPIHFGTWEGILRALLELCGFLVLGTFAVIGWKRWTTFERCMLVVATASVSIPFLVHYEVLDREMVRFWIGTALVLNLLGAAELMRRIQSRQIAVATVGILTIGGIASVLLLNIPFTWQGRQDPVVISRALWVPYLQKETALPKGSIVWGEAETREGEREPVMAQIPLVFGAYAQSCQDLFGHITREDCAQFKQKPSEEGLEALGVTHLLLSDAFVAQYTNEPWFERLSVVRTYPDTSEAHHPLFRSPGRPGGWALFAVLPRQP